MRRRSERSARSSEQGQTLVPTIRAIGEPRDGRLSSVRQCVVHEGVHRSFPRTAQRARSCFSGECSAWWKCGQQFPDSLAHVGILFPGLAATPPPDRAEAHARAEETRRSTGIASNRWRCVMTSLTAHRAVATGLLFITSVCLTSCATASRYQFSEPTAGWQTKTGQLMYKTPKATLIGEAVVRFSNTGDFELTVSKGPGITLLSLRQDARFAEFNASFTGQHWAGPVAQAL